VPQYVNRRNVIETLRAAAILGTIALVVVDFGPLVALETVGVIASFWIVSLWPREVHENAFFIAIIVYFGAFFIVGNAHAELGFYEAAAQIIPVLFLAMAVGSRLLTLYGREEVERRVRIVLIYGFVLGEGYSLDAIAAGHDRGWAFAFVVAALSAAGAVVIAEVVGRTD